MLEDEISYGETYEVVAQFGETDEDPIVMDETYSIKYRFLTRNGGGTEIAAGTIPIADGVGSIEIDTGDEPWEPGCVFFDIRITDPDGDEHVSETVQLTILKTQTVPE